jgi:CelD/BcsL family acetyltransferase involved in cellulose biosynthesis
MTESMRFPLADLDAGSIEAWRDLAAGAVDPNPFVEPAFVLSAFRHMGPSLGAAAAFLFVVTAGDEWLACLPMLGARRWRKVPLPTEATWRHSLSYLGTPLVRAGVPDEVLERIVRPERSLRVLEWVGDGTVSDGLVGAARRRPVRPTVYETIERPALRPDPNFDMREHLGRKRRKELDRHLRLLGKEQEGEVRLDEVTDRPGIDEQLLELERSGWKGQSGTAMAARQGEADFYKETCAAFRDQGRIRVYGLLVSERPVALLSVLHAADRAFWFKIAYDEALRRYSPGTQLMRWVIQTQAADESLSLVDSCSAPSNELALRLFPHRRSLSTIVVARNRAAGTLIEAVKGVKMRRKGQP